MKKIIFITACVSSIASLIYALWQKFTAENNLSRECAILILNTLAQNVPEGENLAEYFSER